MSPNSHTAGLTRRELLRAGLVGFSSLSLADLFRIRAMAKAQKPAEKTAVILVWLRGGGSHLETFDPKPDAPADYRGPYGPIDTNVAGIRIGELLPRLSKLADKYALLRSMAHTGGGHPAGSLQILAGDPDPQDKIKPVYPDWMSVVSYLRRDPSRSLPNYVAVNPVDNYDSFTIAGSTYVGPAYEPFKVFGDPSSPSFEIPNIGASGDKQSSLARRVGLKGSLDQLRRQTDASGVMKAADAVEAQALKLLTSPEGRVAIHPSQKPGKGG